MKQLRLPMTFGQKVNEIFVQILWVPLSAAISFITLSPISLLVWLFHNDNQSRLADQIGWEAVQAQATFFDELVDIWPYFILICWLPFVLVRFLYMPKLKMFQAAPDIHYNVGESDKIKEVKVNRAVTDSSGRTIGYVEDTKYEVEHDDGNRTELSEDSWALIAYCIFALPLRCISLVLSVVALFVATLFIRIQKDPVFEPNFWHIALDAHCGKAFIYVSFSNDGKTATICEYRVVKRGQKIQIQYQDIEYEAGLNNYNCHVRFPKGIFTGNTALNSFYTCRSTSLIEKEAFANCSSLYSIEIRSYHNCIIEENAFLNCSSLRTLRIADSCTIKPNAFRGCSSLKEVILPFRSHPNKEHDPCFLYHIWKIYDPRDVSFKNGLMIPFKILADRKQTAILLTQVYSDYVWKCESCCNIDNIPSIP